MVGRSDGLESTSAAEVAALFESERATVCVVDLDLTLADGDTLFWLLWEIFRKRPFSLAFHRHVTAVLAAVGLRLRSASGFKDHLAQALAGSTRSQLDDLAVRMVDRTCTRLRSEVVAVLQAASENGVPRVLATASLGLYCRPLQERLGLEELLATELEVVEGVATGRLSAPNCKSEEKRRRVERLFEERGWDPASTVFLSDHHSDIYCFDLVGYPIVVSPSSKLAALAAERGFPELVPG